MKRIDRYIILTAATFGLFACTVEEATVHRGSELGALVKEYEVDAASGIQQIGVLSNTTYDISLLGDTDWVTLPATGSGDDGFPVQYKKNDGFPRKASILLSIGQRNQYDTIYLKQEGVLAPVLSFDDAGMVVSGQSTVSSTAPFETNIPLEDISVVATGTEWLHDISLTAQGVVFSTNGNPSATSARKASITLSFVDGWDNEVCSTCYITQTNSSGQFGTEVGFADVRAMGLAGGALIEDDVIIEGIVVSDPASGNMGDNEQLSQTNIDYSICKKTVYLQSPDGAYGFMLQTATEEDNVFRRYDRVKLCLNGALLTKNTNPEYYDLENVTSSMIVSLQAGTQADVPAKAKYIKDLTDADIYTYVQLKDCELPVRKGPMTPVDEKFTNACGVNRYQKTALLLRDINGDDLYVYTNTTCPYRRDGKRLPYGSGTMSGIVVNELYTRFEYADNDSGDEDTYGNIGRYQLRHVSYDDFGMEDDFSDSFSALLTEYRYIVDARPLEMLPTYGNNGFLTHTDRNGGTTRIEKAADFSYLGPVGSSAEYFFGQNWGNINGLGIILEDGTDWQADNTSINNATGNKGAGHAPASVGSAWRVWYNYSNGTATTPNSWILKINTKDITTDQLSMQVSMLNEFHTNNNAGPRYWAVEWSADSWTLETTATMSWTLVDEFSVPDKAVQSPTTQLWQSAGFKPVNISLPLAMLDKEAVYIRIRPNGRLGGNILNYTFNNATSMPYTAMNYLAIRYNK